MKKLLVLFLFLLTAASAVTAAVGRGTDDITGNSIDLQM